MEDVIIRKINKDEIDVLDDMLYEAIFQTEGTIPLTKDVIRNPDISIYIDNFGTLKDDYCFVAELEGRIIGAVWVRILAGDIRGYGNVDADTPEFAISLLKEYRNRGIGTRLMIAMINELKSKNYKQTSLSLDKNNYAVGMYKKLGFEVVKERATDYLMLLDLK